MNNYALYLRKSRADLDAEARGEGETLAKHRAALTDMAKRRGLLIVREYAEIVSGDTIAARPQMQQLLADVKAGLYTGVIVNDVDRLGRGDSIDQEIIKITFAASHTLIITPARDIDPANPTDDQMLDFSLFLARAEYKISARRMAQGRARSAAAGNWVSGSPPYGYVIVHDGQRVRLEPDEHAPIVRMMFDWYARGEAGYYVISKRLTEMGIRTRNGNQFSAKTVHAILKNPAYIGCAVWGGSETVQTIENGQRVKKRVRNKTPTIVEGAHPAIIAPDVWQAVQDRARLARHRSPVNVGAPLKCPLAGLIVCAECGRYMQRIDSRRAPIMMCMTHGCPTSSTYISVIEDALLETLRGWCADYAEPVMRPEPAEDVERREALRHQLETVAGQITRAQELVELGVYTPSEYLARKSALENRRRALTDEVATLARKTPEQARAEILPEIHRVLDAYPLAQTAEQKNALLRTVIDHAVYHKTQAARRSQNPAELLELDVYPYIGEEGYSI